TVHQLLHRRCGENELVPFVDEGGFQAKTDRFMIVNNRDSHGNVLMIIGSGCRWGHGHPVYMKLNLHSSRRPLAERQTCQPRQSRVSVPTASTWWVCGNRSN